MISSGINLVMTVIGFVVSTMFIVFVCTRLICARIHLNSSRRSSSTTSTSDISILERGLHGVEPLVVANFPTKKYREFCLASNENAQCSVCLCEYLEDDTLRILPPCGHTFHATCIDIWLHQHSTCPVCRISLRELPERSWFMQAVRPQYSMPSLNAAHRCHCMPNGQNRRLSGSRNNQVTGPTQEGHCRSEGDGVNIGDGNSIAIHHGGPTKGSENGKVESPSSR